MYALVTGAGGFLGRYIVEALIVRGDRVRGLGRREYPELASLGAEMLRVDVLDPNSLAAACRGVDCVIHTAARPGIDMQWRKYDEVNRLGTLNVIAGCRAAGVQRLVYTSSPSVVFAGNDQNGCNESTPYDFAWMRRNRAYYSLTKALAEQEVLQANGESLRTCALRPHLIWGPRDGHLIPRLISRARSGRLRRVGDGANLVDMIYVENAAEAHLRAADALGETASAVGGKAYFLSQSEPVNCWQWINEILALVDLSPVKKSISLPMARRIGWACEAFWTACRLPGEPPMSRFLASQLATSHWFDISAARRDFGYEPRVSTAEGMRRLGEWLQNAK